MELNRLMKKKQKAIEDGNKKAEAEACNKLGNYYASEALYVKSLNEFKEEAKIYEKLKSKIDYARANRMIGEVLMLQGSFKDALKHEELYLKLAKEENNLLEIQRAYATIGRCYLLIGGEADDYNNGKEDFKSAEKAFLKSLLISKDLGKSVSKYELADMQSRLYLNLGVTKEHEIKLEEATNYYKTALKISTSNDLYESQHRALMCLGGIAAKNEDVSNAMQLYNNAIEVAKRLDSSDDKMKMCETLLAKSELLIKNSDYQSAKQVLKKAYKFKTSVRSDMETIQKQLKIVHALCKYEDELVVTDSFDYEKRKNLFEKLGDGSCKLKNYTKAIDFYQKMLESAELNGETGKKLIPIYVSLYQTYIDMEQYEEAQKYLDLEYELIKDEPKEACSTLMSMGNLLHSSKRDFWEVDAVFRKALCEARKCDDLSLEKIVLRRLITICKEHKMISLAEILQNEAAEREINLNVECTDELSEDLLDSCDVLNDIDFELSTDAESSDDERQRHTPKGSSGVRKKRSIAIKKNAKGETRLHEACINGNYQLVKMLLDQGHAVNVRDNAGWLPLHEAANHGFRDIVELLLDNGAQSSINDKGGVNCDGISPLYDAASNGHLSVVQLLLERGAKATIKTDDNLTPLDALLNWYANSCENLTASEREFYEDIKHRLVEQCEKVGIDTYNKASVVSSFVSSGYSTGKSKNSQVSSSQSQQQQHRNDMRFNTNFLDDTDDEVCYDKEEKQHDNDEKRGDKKKKKLNEESIKKTARLEYKNVMQKLKHPHKDIKFSEDDSVESNNSSSSNIKKRSAYLKEQEVDLDDWLDDDLGPTRKKQKFYNENCLKSSTNEKTSTTLIDCFSQKSNLSRIPSSHSLANEVDDDIENNVECLSDFDINSLDAFDLMMNTNGGDASKKKIRRNSNSAKIQRRGSNLNQSSLLDAGFSRFIEYDDGTRNSYSSPTKALSSSHNSSLNESYNRNISSGIVSNQVEKQTIIKVQIDEEKIIVPINKDAANELKISWLIDESARRYYCLKGIRPELKLKTADGATLIEADSLSLILGCLTEENLIFSEILDWKLPTLSNRYLEACSEYKCGVDREINDLLELNRVAISIDLSNQNLRPMIARPIFKALQHQNCLVHLDISSNFLQDEGVKYLSQTLITLKRLTYLDLSGNAISERGFEHFCGTLLKSTNPTEIKCLKLSYNPIMSNSLRHLSELCRNKSITSVNLTSCELVNGNDMVILNNVKEFNISYNHFSLNGLRDVFRNLNATIIESLNLERCSMESNLGATIVSFITSGCSIALRELNLSALKFNENEILDILRSLHQCSNLINLNLSYQHELTFLSMKYLLFNMNNKNLRVNLIGCRKLHNTSDIINIHTDNTLQLQAHPCHIQLSIPKTMTESVRSEYITKIRELWSNVSDNKGNIQSSRHILYLFSDNQDILNFT
ncbi:hypothetical protein PVAND_013896 [Polypedilum vanderplanki]|uniref:Tonsoku-like protein n=1 Tax=Polypedilum vanderplanki TaxID=319348 RepID=A0A9J6CS45_POLVA|nr:hypothetical protein PVAND_013896 [Polypedilum vanderplanki]